MKRILAALVLALSLAACGETTKESVDTVPNGQTSQAVGASEGVQFPLTVTHPMGETTIESAPQRVVVLDMGALDTMAALDIDPNVVVGLPAASVPDDLSQFSGAADVGTIKEPNLEAIAKLNPDLIIIGGRTAALYEDFSKAYPTIGYESALSDEPALDAVRASAEPIAKVFGKSAALDSKMKDLEAKVDRIKAKTSDAGKAMFVLTNAGDVSMYGTGSRFGFVFTDLGFGEALASSDPTADHGEQITFETIAKANPDVLFVMDRDAAIGTGSDSANAKVTLDNELVNGTNAVKNGKVIYVDPVAWYIVGAGLNNFGEQLDEVEAALK